MTSLSTVSAIDRALALVDVNLREQALAMTELAANIPPISNASLPAMRARFGDVDPLMSDIVIERREVPVGIGHPDVPIYIINAKPGENRAIIVDMHGGGFILGTAEGTLPTLQREARALDCVIVTIDYRLAPETSWSGSTEDNYAALKWVYANAETLGADRSRIIIAGGSAGGGHAALLAINARDRGEVPIHYLALASPMLDDRTGTSRAVPDHIGTFVWTRPYNHFGWKSFLGHEPGGDDVPKAAVPARCDNLAGLPPTFISVGSIDLFVHENIEFAQRLLSEGIGVELFVAPGIFHGGKSPASSVSVRMEQARMDALRQACLNPSA